MRDDDFLSFSLKDLAGGGERIRVLGLVVGRSIFDGVPRGDACGC